MGLVCFSCQFRKKDIKKREKKERRKLAKVVLEEGRRRKRESLVVQLLFQPSFHAISFSLSISFQPKRSSSVYERACSAWREGRKSLLQRECEREGVRERGEKNTSADFDRSSSFECAETAFSSSPSLSLSFFLSLSLAS